MEYEPNVRKFTNNLILFQCKGLFFDGIFNRPYCVHYQWLLLESRTMGGGQGLLLFIYRSVCSTRFLGVFCHTQELLLQIKKLFSISKLPDSIVETIPLLPEKEIHATTHSEYWKSPRSLVIYFSKRTFCYTSPRITETCMYSPLLVLGRLKRINGIKSYLFSNCFVPGQALDIPFFLTLEKVLLSRLQMGKLMLSKVKQLVPEQEFKSGSVGLPSHLSTFPFSRRKSRPRQHWTMIGNGQKL